MNSDGFVQRRKATPDIKKKADVLKGAWLQHIRAREQAEQVRCSIFGDMLDDEPATLMLYERATAANRDSPFYCIDALVASRGNAIDRITQVYVLWRNRPVTAACWVSVDEITGFSNDHICAVPHVTSAVACDTRQMQQMASIWFRDH